MLGKLETGFYLLLTPYDRLTLVRFQSFNRHVLPVFYESMPPIAINERALLKCVNLLLKTI
jgi:hypothetical protein